MPFVLAGVGMALFFTPMANLVLSTVRREQEGQASGANNAIRELGGVFGVAVLASVFSRYGGYETGQTFVDGMTPALWIGAVVVGLGAVAAFAIPAVRTRRAAEAEALAPLPTPADPRRVARVATPSASRPGPLLLLYGRVESRFCT